MISFKMDKAETQILEYLKIAWQDVKICELGNQYHCVFGKAAKSVYESRGVIEHVSMDLNQRDGALLVDLSKPVDPQFRCRFNMVTNYGTTEHVSDQYQVFKNINDMCVLGGVMIHALVLPGNWPEHCRYYYDANFQHYLADLCGYTIVHRAIMNPFDHFQPDRDVIFIAFVKNKENFLDAEIFAKLPIIDTGNSRRTGRYDL
jgi:hypothetical protein